MASIVLEKVCIEFPLYQEFGRSLKNNLLNFGTGGRFTRDASNRVCIRALTDISLEIGHGERLGIVGPNGAGKTTLLRVLAGAYEPVDGHIHVDGSIAPLFDMNLGINPEATGEENIILRGLHLGLSPKQIAARLPAIAEFTELGDYLKMPARTYSSGMLLRLAFAVSTCTEPDILLLDEWILAGDAVFLEKARRRTEAFISKSSILVLASHSQDTIRKWCNRAVYLNRGQIMGVGSVETILAMYNKRANAA